MELVVHENVRAVIARFRLPRDLARVVGAVVQVAGTKPGLLSRWARRAQVTNLVDEEKSVTFRNEPEAAPIASNRGSTSRSIEAPLCSNLDVSTLGASDAKVERRGGQREVRHASLVRQHGVHALCARRECAAHLYAYELGVIRDVSRLHLDQMITPRL